MISEFENWEIRINNCIEMIHIEKYMIQFCLSLDSVFSSSCQMINTELINLKRKCNSNSETFYESIEIEILMFIKTFTFSFKDREDYNSKYECSYLLYLTGQKIFWSSRSIEHCKELLPNFCEMLKTQANSIVLELSLIHI